MNAVAHLKPPLRCPVCRETLNRKLRHCGTEGCSWLHCNSCKALVGPYGYQENHKKGA